MTTTTILSEPDIYAIKIDIENLQNEEIISEYFLAEQILRTLNQHQGADSIDVKGSQLKEMTKNASKETNGHESWHKGLNGLMRNGIRSNPE